MKLDAVNNFLAQHMTESLLQNFITQSSDADVCWFGEKKSVIVVSSLILKMRSEEIFLSKCRCFSMDYGLL